jgi:hypothetical protein
MQFYEIYDTTDLTLCWNDDGIPTFNYRGTTSDTFESIRSAIPLAYISNLARKEAQRTLYLQGRQASNITTTTVSTITATATDTPITPPVTNTTRRRSNGAVKNITSKNKTFKNSSIKSSKLTYRPLTDYQTDPIMICILIFLAILILLNGHKLYNISKLVYKHMETFYKSRRPQRRQSMVMIPLNPIIRQTHPSDSDDSGSNIVQDNIIPGPSGASGDTNSGDNKEVHFEEIELKSGNYLKRSPTQTTLC